MRGSLGAGACLLPDAESLGNTLIVMFSQPSLLARWTKLVSLPFTVDFVPISVLAHMTVRVTIIHITLISWD